MAHMPKPCNHKHPSKTKTYTCALGTGFKLVTYSKGRSEASFHPSIHPSDHPFVPSRSVYSDRAEKAISDGCLWLQGLFRLQKQESDMGLSEELLGTCWGRLWEHIENKKIQHSHPPPKKKKTFASPFLIIMKIDKVFPKRKKKKKINTLGKQKFPKTFHSLFFQQ